MIWYEYLIGAYILLCFILYGYANVVMSKSLSRIKVNICLLYIFSLVLPWIGYMLFHINSQKLVSWCNRKL